MSGAKFTPGPWCIARSRTGYPYQIDASNGVHVRSITRWGAISVPSLPEGEANALLIAAAPDLYDQHASNIVDLNFLRTAIAQGDPKDELLLRVDDLLRRSMAALAKAEGRS